MWRLCETGVTIFDIEGYSEYTSNVKLSEVFKVLWEPKFAH